MSWLNRQQKIQAIFCLFKWCKNAFLLCTTISVFFLRMLHFQCQELYNHNFINLWIELMWQWNRIHVRMNTSSNWTRFFVFLLVFHTKIPPRRRNTHKIFYEWAKSLYKLNQHSIWVITVTSQNVSEIDANKEKKTTKNMLDWKNHFAKWISAHTNTPRMCIHKTDGLISRQRSYENMFEMHPQSVHTVHTL